MTLTDKTCRAAKSKNGKLTKLSDGRCLQLWILPSEAKVWRYAYRDADKKQRTLTIGKYPLVSLAEARVLRDDADKLKSQGVDPSRAKRISKAQQRVGSDAFDILVDGYEIWMRGKAMAEVSIIRNISVLKPATRQFAGRKIRTISRAEIWAVIEPVLAGGKYSTARCMCRCISKVFRLAISSGRADADPTAGMQEAIARPPVTHRAAFTEPAQLGRFLIAVDAYGGALTTVAALKLTSMLFPRPGDLRKMSYFDLNLDAAIWTVHKAAKTGKRYLVPLPHQAVEILQALKSTARSDFVFPNNRSNRRTISENTLNAAMRYLGFSSNQVCAHGFRTTASTILNEAGQWNSDAIERQLDHGFEPVRGIYARGKYWDERVEMMQKWADYLDQLRVTSKPGLIVPHLRAVA